MLNVALENIIADSEAIAQVSELLRRADEDKQLIVITRNGKPAVAMLGIEQLESLSGHTVGATSAPLAAPAPAMPIASPEQPPAAEDSSLPDMPLI